MATKSKVLGYDIAYKNNQWVYADTLKPITIKRPCKNCGKTPTKEGHDNCLGTLIGVKNACCGHGIENEAFIQFLDGNSINGKDALVILNVLKRYRNEVENKWQKV